MHLWGGARDTPHPLSFEFPSAETLYLEGYISSPIIFNLAF